MDAPPSTGPTALTTTIRTDDPYTAGLLDASIVIKPTSASSGFSLGLACDLKVAGSILARFPPNRAVICRKGEAETVSAQWTETKARTELLTFISSKCIVANRRACAALKYMNSEPTRAAYMELSSDLKMPPPTLDASTVAVSEAYVAGWLDARGRVVVPKDKVPKNANKGVMMSDGDKNEKMEKDDGANGEDGGETETETEKEKGEGETDKDKDKGEGAPLTKKRRVMKKAKAKVTTFVRLALPKSLASLARIMLESMEIGVAQIKASSPSRVEVRGVDSLATFMETFGAGQCRVLDLAPVATAVAMATATV